MKTNEELIADRTRNRQKFMTLRAFSKAQSLGLNAEQAKVHVLAALDRYYTQRHFPLVPETLSFVDQVIAKYDAIPVGAFQAKVNGICSVVGSPKA